MVANERKRGSETYHQFSLRLRSMAAASTRDGLETVESNNFALSALISNAWPRHADSLRLIINEDSADPLHEMDHAVSRLCGLAKSQGVLSTRTTGNGNHVTRPVTGKRMSMDPSTKRESRQLDPNVKRENRQREVKRTRREPRDYSKARCGECGELGHTTGYHDRFVARQQGMAHAAAAKEESHPDSDDPEFGRQETSDASE